MVETDGKGNGDADDDNGSKDGFIGHGSEYLACDHSCLMLSSSGICARLPKYFP